MKLTIELVPRTAWYSNVRSNVTKDQWDKIRKQSYEKAGHKCEVCKDKGTNQGFRHNVECHEIWDYNDKTKKQTLTGMVSLCPKCHEVKHIGLAQIKGRFDLAVEQLMKVNDISLQEAHKYIDSSFNIWSERSEHDWELDITYLDEIH
jgi:ssDNA-binding Zn-finger/Zn-ribbon topoisomerase 1